MEHIMIYDIFHQDTDEARYLTMRYFAEYENCMYVDANYWMNPREIDAQYAGILGAYDYCEAQFGHDEAERLLCDYQNTRIRNGKKVNGLFHRHRKPDYLDFQNGKPYESSDEIFDAMDVELEKSFHAHRIYDIKSAAKNPVQNRSVLFFQKNAKISHEMDYLKCFTSCQDGYLQDKMLTAIFLSDPEYHRYYQSRFESIADMDLSIETVFHDAMRLERGRELDTKFGNMITSENQYDDDMEKE